MVFKNIIYTGTLGFEILGYWVATGISNLEGNEYRWYYNNILLQNTRA